MSEKTLYQFKHTISRAAAVAAYSMLYRVVVDPDDYVKVDPVAEMLDRALSAPGGADQREEVFCVDSPDEVTFVCKLRLERFTLVGVLCPIGRRDFRRRWAGDSGLILVNVCSMHKAAARIKNGGWRSMDGEPVLQPRPELGDRVPSTEDPPSAAIPSADSPPCVAPLDPSTWEFTASELLPQVKPGVESKKCSGPCSRFLPATADYFYTRSNGELRSRCKDCLRSVARDHGVKVRAEKKRKREEREARLAQVCAGPNTDGVCVSGTAGTGAVPVEITLPDHGVCSAYTDSHNEMFEEGRRMVELRALFAAETAQRLKVDTETAELRAIRTKILSCIAGFADKLYHT